MISTRPGVTIQEDYGVRCVLGDSVLTDSDRKEFAANDKWEAERARYTEGRRIFEDVIKKSNFIQTFQQVVPRLKLSGGEKFWRWAHLIVGQPFCSRRCTRTGILLPPT